MLGRDDVRPFVQKFDELDVSKTGRISSEDLDTFYSMERQRHDNLMEKLGWDEATKLMTKDYEADLAARIERKLDDGTLYQGLWQSDRKKAINRLKMVVKMSASPLPLGGGAALATAPVAAQAPATVPAPAAKISEEECDCPVQVSKI